MTDEQKLAAIREIVSILSSGIGLPIVLLYAWFTERRRHWFVVDGYITDYRDSLKYYRDEAASARLQAQIINAPRIPLGVGLAG